MATGKGKDTEQKGYIPIIDGPAEYIHRTDGKQMRSKVNNVQKLMRVQQVASWLLDGLTYSQVATKGTKKWGLAKRSIERYIAAAQEQVETMAATEVRGATTLAIHRLSELYFRALEAEDLRTALDIIKTQNRMLGLNAPDKVEARQVEQWSSMSVAEQLEKVQGILERATDGGREVN